MRRSSRLMHWRELRLPRPEQALAASRPMWTRLLLLAFDVVLFNFVFYRLLRALLLAPLGIATIPEAVFWTVAFLATLLLLHTIRTFTRERFGGFISQLGFFGGMAGFLCAMATKGMSGPNLDLSWLRVEIVKVPLWIGMFTRASPGFTGAAVVPGGTASASGALAGAVEGPGFTGCVLLILAVLAWGCLAAPGNWIVRLAPGLVVFGFGWLIVRTFSAVRTEHGGADEYLFYLILFSGPLFIFWLLIVARAFSIAFRLSPLVLHMLLVSLNYIGYVPAPSLSPEFHSEARTGGPARANQFGVARLLPADNATPPAPFNFLRAMVLSPESSFISFGPTCGIYSINRDTGALGQLTTRGLLRDMNWSPDGRYLWATNWKNGQFLAVDPANMKTTCVVDMFEDGLKTPWKTVVDSRSGRIFMSNVTPPIVAELKVVTGEDGCSISVVREIDFHAEGYTRFTDGAFGLHDGKEEVGLVELDLNTFRILRDVRVTAGSTLVAVRGRDTVLAPAYWRDEIAEISLDDMRVVRTIHAAPTVLAIEQDEKRGLFYATSRTTGELLVIDDRSGAVLRRYSVGAKPDALRMDPRTDQLFLGGGSGIFRVDLPRFVDGSK